MARLKAKLPVPASREEADALLGRIGDDQRQLELISAGLTETVAREKLAAAAEALPIAGRLKESFAALHVWAQANRAELLERGRKSVSLSQGTIGWRMGNPEVRIGRGQEDLVVATLGRLGRGELIRTRQEGGGVAGAGAGGRRAGDQGRPGGVVLRQAAGREGGAGQDGGAHGGGGLGPGPALMPAVVAARGRAMMPAARAPVGGLAVGLYLREVPDAPVTIAVYPMRWQGPRCVASLSEALLRRWLRWTHGALRVQARVGEGDGALLRLKPSLDGGRPLERHGARRNIVVFIKRALPPVLGYVPAPHRALPVAWEVDWNASAAGHDLLIELPECWRP